MRLLQKRPPSLVVVVEVVEDQQGAEVEVEVEVVVGGEEVELSQDTQLEEFRPIMELLADKQKPRKNLAKTQSADRHFPQCPVSFRYFQS